MVIYKCPSCGANMKFNSKTQTLTCDYCEQSVPMEQADRLKQAETADFKLYRCPSCGAEVMTDEYTAATFCSFCQSPTLVEDKLEGELAPSRLIAFKKNKEQAKESYRAWTKKGLLTPSGFSKESTLEKVSGIYVPFWLYDYDAHVNLEAEATKVRSERRGNTQYTHTDYFLARREVEADFQLVPADASEKMDDTVMDQLEPFNYQELMPFQMSYLSGYYAERYNYDSQQMKPRIEARIKKYARECALDTIKGYSTKRVLTEQYHFRMKKSEYVMLPVWILNYRYKGKDYQFSMNGQTGKIVGSLPISIEKGAAYFIGIAAAIFIILQVIFMFV